MPLTMKNYSQWFAEDADEATILRRIHTEMDKARVARSGYDTVNHFKHLAIYRLASLNGWTTGPHVRDFRVEDIGRRSGEWPLDLGRDLLDHPIYFRRDGRCAAVIAEPYDHIRPEQAYAYAERRGMACHIPPAAHASFHYPGWAICIAFTAPGHVMKWLPEQLNGIEGIEPREWPRQGKEN